MRHPDHRFEWDRAEFAAWCDAWPRRTATPSNGAGVGDVDATLGTPTQLAIFSRREGHDD